MTPPRNPFILGHKLYRPYFCDRIEEQKQLASAVTNGRNVVLISPRRMGKTSLAYLTIHDSANLTHDYLSIFIDILQTNSLSEFTYLLGKAIFDALKSKNENRLRSFLAALKSIKGSFGFDPMSGTPTFNIQLGDIKYPEYTLDEIFQFIESNDKPLIITIDEFQQIINYPEKNTEAILRSHIQRLTNTSFIFAGSEQTILHQMFVSSKRPFYNSAEIIHLNPIDEDVYVDFAKDLFGQYNKTIDDESIRWVFNLFNGNTFYLQRTMNGAFAETDSGDHCSHYIVLKAVKSMLRGNEMIYREILSKISAAQKSVLFAVAKDKIAQAPTSGAFIKRHALTSASSVQSAILKLQKSGLINNGETGYTISDPLLRIFINELYGSSEF